MSRPVFVARGAALAATPRRGFLIAPGLLALLACAGCGGPGKLYKVEGTVTFEDKPLEGATVLFFQEDGGGQAASGVTGSDGSFRLTTVTTGDGARAGDYKVLVTLPKSEAEPNIPGGGKDNAENMKAMKEFAMKAKKKDTGKPQLPANYGDRAKTPLKYKVPPDGSIEIQLRKSGS
jgi:hypothetical protein